MKIAKFQTIKNMAVFKDFIWDSSVCCNNSVVPFRNVNVIFGNNYSGKTTLSRIVRAFETGTLSDKYSGASFQLLLDDNTIISERDYTERIVITRVFNEDFVRENLRFVVDQNSDILPFAVLGENNAKIEEEIEVIKQKIGTNDQDNPTGLYKELSIAKEKSEKANKDFRNAKKDLEEMENAKATNRQTGIKYNMKRFNRQNYNITSLKKDIETVLRENIYNTFKR